VIEYRQINGQRTLKVPRGRSEKCEAFFVQIFGGFFRRGFVQTVQRRKTCANCGEEIGLKALSHPTGTLTRDCACPGDAGNPSLCGKAVGSTSGRRSPLSARFTEISGLNANTPVLGNDGKEIKLAVNNATSTPITRTNEILRIGSSPKPQHPQQSPRDKCGTEWPRATGNVPRPAQFRLARQPHLVVMVIPTAA
jgi:hypothetical protein